MKKNTDPLVPDTCYHIFNRGINGENIFKEKRNYSFFLNKYSKYIGPIAFTYSFCLLKNHFHFLIRTRSEEIIKKCKLPGKNYEPEQIISLQFGHLFNSYAQAINKRNSRTGGLFETPFRRIEIKEERYLIQLIPYMHFNPVKHGFTSDYTNYPYSSYRSLLKGENKLLDSKTVMNWFGNRQLFVSYHKDWSEGSDLNSEY
ncbi:MAG: hypothetical protein WC220_09100 [Pedobacter sp.]|jgi:hypothetical protein